MLIAGFVIAASQAISSPIEFGRAELARIGARNVDLAISASKTKESYHIRTKNGKTTIVGSDQAGAMYGAFEYAERLKNHQPVDKVEGHPYLAERGLNLFLTLPWDYKKNDTDYDVAALTNPERWWFHNENYWTTLLDLMAKSRLNWLDIHGMWDISVTDAPNLYAYFVTAPTYPQVGIPEKDKQKNLTQLNHVIEMAHARGIKVSLMAYQADLRIPQNRTPPYKFDEDTTYLYTREVVEQMIRDCPGLDGIGFRIGESGKGESFFKCYGEAVSRSGRDIPLITRSWITRKQRVLPLARAAKDFTVEIKYNGEQWGTPYMVAGGRVANWYSYSFEDYLSDSGKQGVKTWPGNPTPDGQKWPSEPYKIVWQVRSNGTHRIFPFYNPDWVRRTISCMKIGTASGFTVEGEDCYFPKSPDYYLANPADKYFNWIHQRDEMYWMTWGRLGYDPTLPDATFDSRAADLLSSNALVQAWKQASVLVSKAFMAFTVGPDHRSYAPELEWGGNTYEFIHGQGFDTFVNSPIDERGANSVTGGRDSRDFAPFSTSWLSQSLVNLPKIPDPKNPFAKEVAESIKLERALGQYYQQRFRDAFIATQAGTLNGGSSSLLNSAKTNFDLLASSTFYKPFTDRLRMHTNTFSWRDESKKLADLIAQFKEPNPAELKYQTYDPSVEVLKVTPYAKVSWKVNAKRTTFSVKSEATSAWLLEKPLPSTTFFHRIPMKKTPVGFELHLPRRQEGSMFAFEVDGQRQPDVRVQTPYYIVPSLPGPTPQIYSAEEAMTYLDPKMIDPARYGGMIIGTRAFHFFNDFDRATKRKLLDPVSRGMRLVILQQDFGKNKLDWLPKALAMENVNLNQFFPGGQLGLVPITAAGIIWQRFLPSEGWDVFGNRALARLKFGNGEIWVCSARLMQTMQFAAAARDFVSLLSLGGKDKPTILIDSCSEGADFASSCHPDLMNSHEIPFLTLGEVIAQEQGMNSFKPVPGQVDADNVLDGKGSEIANRFFRNQVIAASHRPTPASLSSFEVERKRRKTELMKCLGLDPMPPKTPLNARVTGTIQGSGYRIEKVVYESRPNFFVTAHVYLPLAPMNGGERGLGGEGSRFPVIVNVNGHWAHKKDEDRIQLRCQFQALQGYIAIAIDSPGRSFEGDSLSERRAEGDHNDWFLVQGGINATGIYVWDAIRALDYMATRSDTDMNRVGITGASGGGLATLYAFAADDRYKAAVPVVYMASMELAPDNGCLCNHVPGTCQIGDRSDVIAIQAPKPVYVMGAENDGEFPPDATRLTFKKMQETWSLFGAQKDVLTQIFAGPHDYNQLMREASIGFFNKYLKGMGDGSPVPQPALTAIDPEDRSLLALDPPPVDERKIRDVALEMLEHSAAHVSVRQAIEINGGVPAACPLKLHLSKAEHLQAVTFESEPGLVTPGLLVLPEGRISTVQIFCRDEGKSAGPAEPGIAKLYLDLVGTGELNAIEMRYPIYLGRSLAFTGGWQLVRAAEAMRRYASRVEIVADGPLASQAAMWAGLMMPNRFAKIMGTRCLTSWQNVFGPGVAPNAIQPRANLLGSLDKLRGMVARASWGRS